MIAIEKYKKNIYDFLFERSDYIIIVLSSEGIILDFNHIAEIVFGWRSIDVIGKDFLALLQQANIEYPFADLNHIKYGNPQSKITTLNSLKNQERFIQWQIINLTPDPQEASKAILLFGDDITAYKKNELTIKKTNVYLKNIVNNLPHFLIWKDSNSVFLGCNKMFADSIGLESPQDIIGKTDYDFPWAAEQAGNYVEDDKQIVRTGRGRYNYEESQTQLDGSIKVMLVSKVPMYDEMRKISGILVIYTDITERKRLEESLRKAKEEAERANDLKMEFIRNMHHDIRTPLSGMIGLPKILMEMEEDSMKRDVLDKLSNCAESLLKYCDEILEFSRFISEEVPVLAAKFNLFDMISELEKVETPVTKLRELKFTIRYKNNVPEIIIGDNIRLYRILINLLSNAIKFTPSGYVSLTIENALHDPERNKIVLKFIVEDSGIGIPKDKQTIIYEKFYRVEPSNTGKYTGFGLGLHEVKKFIDDMQGELDLYSEIGQGATFICTLPFRVPLVKEFDD